MVFMHDFDESIGLTHMVMCFLGHFVLFALLSLGSDQKHGAGVGGLKTKAEVQEDKRVRVPSFAVMQPRNIESHPTRNDDGLSDEEFPANRSSQPLGSTLTKRLFH